ncbi:hypothetical protein R1sor_012286 [Riccia sorocarpa]|uniref:Uncharacterized protein n=1 Tax=Riccia sorocarpa TaxID=122646 RepID=A0ABD3I751_9MARC
MAVWGTNAPVDDPQGEEILVEETFLAVTSCWFKMACYHPCRGSMMLVLEKRKVTEGGRDAAGTLPEPTGTAGKRITILSLDGGGVKWVISKVLLSITNLNFSVLTERM